MAEAMIMIGPLLKAGGSIMAGNSARDAQRFQAAQLERQAIADQASGSRSAAEEHRQKRLKLSRARAVGAASGGGRAFGLEGDIAGEGEYAALTAIFEGNEMAAGHRMQAAASRYDGDVARQAGFISAAGSMFEGASSLYEKYSDDED